ncbi:MULTISPECIES: DeoR/GlpR family DNA-binding transcription regulator [unclassified Ensifer]|uniref:DeoR/GlpR family DNA-binding transcription regulator n=1 Tax=unclassified Ensifer TaxID=2633371 RepID=UPI000812DEFE|nr:MULTISPECIES: DeoR/GlpR family DNA-binding transcription regulator [unclassified Ensifer]OCP19359.1 DeoR family transcriptional regulator [Ensifer sp. LC54]OCP19516.1 DeoR family transcriptional regulator [Ensifer sp. LC384]
MKPGERREEIAEYIMRAGQARIEDLVEHFGVSRMTIHRHIDQLAQQGILRKLHGMVTVQPSGLYESAFRYRDTVGKVEKETLAKAAMAYVEPGQAIMLDDSSTASALAPLLPVARPLTVITNSYVSASKLIDIDDVELICLGGRYHRTYNAYIGITCEKAIASLRANVLFCSASAVDGVTAFIQDAAVTKVKQAMMASSSRRILLLDHSKFGRVALNVLADLTDFDVVLTTDGINDDHRRRLLEAGVNLQIIKATKTHD